MPPTVPIDRGIVVLFSNGLKVTDLKGGLVSEYIKKGCSTVLVGEGGWDGLAEDLLEVETFKSKAGKIGVYYSDHAPSTVKSEMVEICSGGLAEGIQDKEHKLVICVAKPSDVEHLNDFLQYHLENPNRPHTPWIVLVVPCDEELYSRHSVLEELELGASSASKLNSGKRVSAVSISMCPGTCRVDSLTTFDWKLFIDSAGGVALKPGDSIFELCYRVGMSPKFGD